MMDLARRIALADRLLALDTLPARVTDAFAARYPERMARFGDAGRAGCTGDGRFHLCFLAGAVGAGSPEVFTEYVRWAAAVIEVRKIDRAHLAAYLNLLGEQLDSELSGADAALVGALLAAGRAALASLPSMGEPATGEPATGEPPQDERAPVRLAYLSAALAGRRAEAYRVVSGALVSGWPLLDVYRDLLLRCQHRLGELWAKGEISVAQEHMASAITQWVLARLDLSLFGRAPCRGRVLIAGVEGELHALPPLFAADFLQLEGWDVVFVGTHVPGRAILSAIDEQKPDIVGLSATMAFNLPKTAALVRAIRDKQPDLRLVLGGRAFHGTEPLAAELDVDLDASGSFATFGA